MNANAADDVPTQALRRTPRNKLQRVRVVLRERYILEACKGKPVLHIGCADAPFTRAKLSGGTLLHQKLAEVTSSLAGFDIAAEEIAWLRTQGFDNLHCGDALRLEADLPALGFEPAVVVVGEVLEHLASPLELVRAVRETMGDDSELIVSVPSAFNVEGFVHVLLGAEKVHPQHVAYYSRTTIQELLRRGGFRTIEIHPYREEGSGGRLVNSLRRSVYRLYPHLAVGYVLKATPFGVRNDL